MGHFGADALFLVELRGPKEDLPILGENSPVYDYIYSETHEKQCIQTLARENVSQLAMTFLPFFSFQLKTKYVQRFSLFSVVSGSFFIITAIFWQNLSFLFRRDGRGLIGNALGCSAHFWV